MLLSRIGGAAAIGRHFAGARKAVALVLSANQANYNLDTSKVSDYVAGITDVVLTINSGVVIGSTSTATYALNVDTSWNAGDTIKIVNAGTIEGAGGAGGAANFGDGSAGGPALRCQRAVSVDNTGGVIASGGKGGSGGVYTGVYFTNLIQDFGKGPVCTSVASYLAGYANGGAGGTGAGAGASGTYAATAGSVGQSADAAIGLQCNGASGAPAYGETGATGGALGNGAYITGNANVTWLATGTRTGTVIA